MRSPMQEEFFVTGKSKESLSENDLMVVELEQRINNLQIHIEKLEKELPARERAAYDKGFAEGSAQGRDAERETLGAQHAAKMNELQKRFNSFCAGVQQSKQSIYANAHTVLLALCFEIAEKIMGAEALGNPDSGHFGGEKGPCIVADKERIIIRVAKDDLETVSGRKDFWLPVGERITSLIIEADERIERGGCVIESNSGVADAPARRATPDLRGLVETLWESLSAPAGQSPGGQTGAGA